MKKQIYGAEHMKTILFGFYDAKTERNVSTLTLSFCFIQYCAH